MQRTIVTFAMSMMLLSAYGQQKQGVVLYERTQQMPAPPMQDEAMARFIPRSRQDKVEVLFGNNQSLRRSIQDERPEPAMEEGGMRVGFMMAGANDITFTDFAAGSTVEQRELGMVFDCCLGMSDGASHCEEFRAGYADFLYDHNHKHRIGSCGVVPNPHDPPFFSPNF
jgi:hypothetical protein